jgi:ribosomal protein L40E
MAVWICRDCTAAYSVGAPQCPQCGSTDRIEEEEQNMPKITVAGGPSIAGISGSWGDEPEHDEGGEQSSPSSSSSASETKPDSEQKTTSSGGSKRARTTGSRGARDRTGSSSARSTDSDRTAPTSETGSDED